MGIRTLQAVSAFGLVSLLSFVGCGGSSSGPSANSCYASSDVYAQDVDASGNSLWQLNGYPLLADPGNQGEQYYLYTPLPAVVSVPLISGDIFLAWPDGRDNVCFPTNP